MASTLVLCLSLSMLPGPCSGFASTLPHYTRPGFRTNFEQLRCHIPPTSPPSSRLSPPTAQPPCPVPLPSGPGTTVSRRSVLLAGFLAIGAATPVPAEVVPQGDLFTDSQFQIFVPKGFFKSRRKVQEGTLFTSGNLKTAEIVSVQKLSTERLLMDAGVVPTGDLSESWEKSIGKAEVVAGLLARARDNDAKNSAGIPSKVEKGSVSADGKTLKFRMLTEMSTQKDPIKRVTVVRAELLPDRSYLAVWASCLEEDFGPDTRARLEYALNSLVPRDQR